MLAGSSAYRRRLVRMKTVSSDCRKYRSSVLLSESPGSCVAGKSSSPKLASKKQRTVASASVGSAVGLQGGHRAIRESPKCAKDSSDELWMREPTLLYCENKRVIQPYDDSNSSTVCLVGTSGSEDACFSNSSDPSSQQQQQQRSSLATQSLLDLQTNNSRRDEGSRQRLPATYGSSTAGTTDALVTAGNPGGSSAFTNDYGSDDSEQEYQNSNAETSLEEVSNENAVAKGANALVKQATSRQTEIIDTSKLLEEGKVETQYEEPEDEPEEIEETDYALIDEYEKTFAYARRLRALLNMKFKVVDRSSIETNFLLVKAHDHPTQKVLDRWRNVDMGQPYDYQIRMKKLIDDFKATCGQKKKPKKGEVREAVFPDWIRFTFRFKKDMADKRWDEYTAYKQRMKKLSGGVGAVPKANDKYLPAYYDIWSTSIVVFAKPETTVLNMVDPVFSKLGLGARADFKFTIGSFVGDKRAGKAKIPGAPVGAEEVAMQTLCGDLYKRNCVEIFVNDDRIEMFKAFPSFYLGDVAPDQLSKGSKDGKGKGGKGKKGGKNQSNKSASNAAGCSIEEAVSGETEDQHNGLKERQLTARLSTVRKHLRSNQPGSEAADSQRLTLGGDTVNTDRSAGETLHSRAGLTSVSASFGSAGSTTVPKKKSAKFRNPAADTVNYEQDYNKSSPNKFGLPESAAPGDEEMDVDFDSSPSATNQNLSIHDCDSSDESQPTLEETIASVKAEKSEIPATD